MSQSPTRAQSSSATDRYTKAWTATNTLIRQGHSFSGHEKNCCFLNTGSHPFADVSSALGLDFAEDGRSLATVDWDQDGDLDLWITNRTAPRVRFLRNDYPRSHHFLAVRLQGQTCNRDAVGARLELYFGQQRKQIKTLSAGDGFLGQSSKTIHFGLGDYDQIERLVVRWPGGPAEEFRDLEVDRHYAIVQGADRAGEWSPSREQALAPADMKVPPSSEAARVVLIGRVPVPDAEYLDSSGEVVRLLGKLRDRPLLVNFWATWCQPCLAELQQLSLQEQQLRSRLDILALCVDGLNKDLNGRDSSAPLEPDAVLRQLEFPYSSGAATSELVTALDGVQRTILDRQRPLPIPSSFLIDKHGQLAIVYKGPVGARQLLSDLSILDMQPDQLRDIAIPFPGRWETRPQATDPQRIAVALYDANLLDLAARYTFQMDTFLTDGVGRKYMDERIRIKKLTDAHAFRGMIRVEQNNLEDAVAAFSQSLALSPQDLRAHIKLGEALVKLGRIETAAKHFSTAVSIVPDDPNLRYDLAIALTDLGRLKEAIEHYRQVLRLRPGWPPAANNLAWILATHPDESIRSGQAAVELATETCRRVRFRDPMGLDTLAAAYAEVGDFAKAREVAGQAIQLARSQANAELVDKLQSRLRQYNLDKPFRDRSLGAGGG